MEGWVSKDLWATHIIPMILRSDPYNTRQRGALARVSRFFHQVVCSVRISMEPQRWLRLNHNEDVIRRRLQNVFEHFYLRPQLVLLEYSPHDEISRMLLAFLYEDLFNFKNRFNYYIYAQDANRNPSAMPYINVGFIIDKLRAGNHVLFLADPHNFRVEWLYKHATIDLNNIHFP